MSDPKIRTRYSITTVGSMDLSENEMRALEAITSYGTDRFLEMFYRQMGKAYLEPYEHGLRNLFKKIKDELRPALAACDNARVLLKEQEKKQ